MTAGMSLIIYRFVHSELTWAYIIAMLLILKSYFHWTFFSACFFFFSLFFPHNPFPSNTHTHTTLRYLFSFVKTSRLLERCRFISSSFILPLTRYYSSWHRIWQKKSEQRPLRFCMSPLPTTTTVITVIIILLVHLFTRLLSLKTEGVWLLIQHHQLLLCIILISSIHILVQEGRQYLPSLVYQLHKFRPILKPLLRIMLALSRIRSHLLLRVWWEPGHHLIL